MRQISEEFYWICVVEEGDTPETVAHWIEDNLTTPLPRGSVDMEQWYIEPKPGDLIIFQAPESFAMMRYIGNIRKLPTFASTEELHKMQEGWIDPVESYSKPSPELNVVEDGNMLPDNS